MESLALQELERLWSLFPLKKKPVVVWRGYRVSAGMAYLRTYHIGLSNRVLQDEAAMLETLRHEYAHLMAYDRHGPRAAGHGEPWKQAMRELGLQPTVRHKLPVERNTPRQRVIYICVRCGLEFHRTRRLTKGRKYMHAKCGGGLKLKGVESLTPASPDS